MLLACQAWRPDVARAIVAATRMMESCAVRVRTLRLPPAWERQVPPALLDLLDAEERARAARFVQARDRALQVAAHALKRRVLADALGCAPGALRFRAGPHGKPSALVGDVPASLSFNLSHTRGLAGIAVCADPAGDVGFDVEGASRAIGQGVEAAVLRPEERRWLAALPTVARPEGFMRLWTLKEAVVKATGEGLSRDLQTFWLEPGPPPVLHLSPDRAGEPWHADQRLLEGGFVAAVALRGPTRPVVAWETLSPAELDRAFGT